MVCRWLNPVVPGRADNTLRGGKAAIRESMSGVGGHQGYGLKTLWTGYSRRTEVKGRESRSAFLQTISLLPTRQAGGRQYHTGVATGRLNHRRDVCATRLWETGGALRLQF